MEYTKLLGKVTLTTDGLHDSNKAYDRLCLVYDSAYRSFVSIKDVPANISIDNKTYWQPLNILTVDNEDLMVDENLRIKFANKEYNPLDNSGMGYTILRKRKGNILTQEDFNKANTLYVVEYAFNIEDTIAMPEGCAIYFKGGTINGGTLVGTNTMAYGTVSNKGTSKFDGTWLETGIGSGTGPSTPGGDDDKPSTISNFTTFIFAHSEDTPSKPTGGNWDAETNTFIPPTGWYTTDEVESELPLWMSWATFDTTGAIKGDWANPIKLTGSNGQDGANGTSTEFIYKSVKDDKAPEKPISVSQDGYVPSGWANSPTGVSADKMYEWVSTRKYRNDEWGEFSNPSLWAKWAADGKDGESISSNFTAFVFKTSEIQPSKPQGGNWNPTTNTFTPPTGWYTTDTNLDGTLWMAWAMFGVDGQIIGEWSTPVRLSGADGKDGVDGKSIEFIYHISNRMPNSADKPSSANVDGDVPAGWTDNPSGVSESNQYEWMCNRTKVEDTWSDWNGPTVWSKWGANGKDGDGVEYIYQRTSTNVAPDRPTGSSDEDEYVPGGWTDNPTGVSDRYMYEWVCIRKSKDGVWGEFSNPALWAKWGETGPTGLPGADGTSVNIKGTVDSTSDLPSNAEPGDSYIVNNDLYIWDGLQWKNVGGIKGPAGDSAYVHIAYADGVTYSGSTVTGVTGFTTSDDANKAYIGIYADHTLADSQNPLDYAWKKFKGDKGDKGDTGDKGDKGDKGDTGPAGVATDGKDGVTYYTWIRYAENANGGGISNNPDGKPYIGFAYNKLTAVESNNPSDYTWSKIKGEDGVGQPGSSLYTWIKYATALPTSSDSVIYDVPNENTKYIGIAINKETATEGTDPMLYTWSLFRGNDGTNGVDGRIVYPAGKYDANVTYVATDKKAPYVLYNDTYYVMQVTTSWNGTNNDGKTPADDYAQYGEHATWIPMEQFEAIYTKLLIADGGTLGKFVFNGDYMFSQEGVDNIGNMSNRYQMFNNTNNESSFWNKNIWSDVQSGTGDDIGIADNLPILSVHKVTKTEQILISANNYPIDTLGKGYYVDITLPAQASGNGPYYEWRYFDVDGDYMTVQFRKSGVYYIDDWYNAGYAQEDCCTWWFMNGDPSTVYYSHLYIVPEQFKPNMKINAVTGEVIANNLVAKGRLAQGTILHKITQDETTHDLSLTNNDHSFKTLYIVQDRNVTQIINDNTFRITTNYLDAINYDGDDFVQAQLHVVNLSTFDVDILKPVGAHEPAFTIAGTPIVRQASTIRLYPGAEVTVNFLYNFYGELGGSLSDPSYEYMTAIVQNPGAYTIQDGRIVVKL